MHYQSNAARGSTPTTFLVSFAAGDMGHLAADRLQQLGFRAVVRWLDHGWEVQAGALTTRATEASTLKYVQRVADRYEGRVDHAHGGWEPARLELVPPAIDPDVAGPGELSSPWSRLTEATENNAPSPYTTMCAEWAAELERRFLDWEPPPDDGWHPDARVNGGRP